MTNVSEGRETRKGEGDEDESGSRSTCHSDRSGQTGNEKNKTRDISVCWRVGNSVGGRRKTVEIRAINVNRKRLLALEYVPITGIIPARGNNFLIDFKNEDDQPISPCVKLHSIIEAIS